MADEAAFLITCDAEVARQIDAELVAPGVEIEGSSRRGLDGTQAASWMVIATVAVKTAPTFLTALREFLTRNEVASITVGDTTIHKPRAADVDRLLGPAQAVD